MTPKINIPDKLVRDCLTKGQVHWVLKERERGTVQLIALVTRESSFAGYFPINAGLPEGLKPNFNDDGTLDTMPVVTGG